MVRSWLACVGALVTALLAQNAFAGSVLDQAYEPPGSYAGRVGEHPRDPSFRWAQVFTVGVTGELDKAEVLANGHLSHSGYTATLSVLGTASGAPSGSALASASILDTSLSLTEAWWAFDFPNVFVTAGGEYALVLSYDGVYSDNIYWRGNEAGGYTGGAAYYAFGSGPWTPHAELQDLDFRTYVVPTEVGAVPVPPAAWLGATCLLGLLLIRRLRLGENRCA